MSKFAITSRHFARVLIFTAILTFLLLAAGYLLRFNETRAVCSAWPACYGGWEIPAELGARLELGHRILAGIAGLMVFTASVFSFTIRGIRWLVRGSLLLAAFGFIIGSWAGRIIVFNRPDIWSSNFHLIMAMWVLGLVAAAAVLVNIANTGRKLIPSLNAFTRLTIAALASVFILMVSGAWITSSGAGQACSGWPLCGGGLPETPAAWLAFSHRILTLISGALITGVFISAWRKAYHQPVILVSATGSGLLFLGQIVIGALNTSRGYPVDLAALHAAATAALWASLVITATASLVIPITAMDSSGARQMGFARMKAFLMLNKPVIVLLLLVTTYAGMVVGGKQIPGLSLTFWTLLGGALAAGGASALNQVIDREVDGLMQRTAKRPIPAGILTPAEGLAYGLGACLGAFFILAGFVNLLAAVLSLAGMIYYVLLYSIWLKHATVQNIVIGGGAGAIPPLVGWAAATGSLNIPSLFLFAIVFMWTPPHFWALAIVRKNDYARAGVPMLPVVKGEQNTRLQIFIYTLELVGLTLLLPLFDMAGSLFLVSAVLLGLWLIAAAWKVLRTPGNKVAWTMYRSSSMYLAFIFLALVVDVLV